MFRGHNQTDLRLGTSTAKAWVNITNIRFIDAPNTVGQQD